MGKEAHRYHQCMLHDAIANHELLMRMGMAQQRLRGKAPP
jgi:hypothetical protein